MTSAASGLSSGESKGPVTTGCDSLNVLLVDDEPDIGLAAGEALTDAGHRVSVATSGAQALEMIGQQVFEVMICDVRLPGVDGLTLFRRTRQESPDTAVILMTAFAAVQDAVAAVKDGAHDYLTKPFDIDEIPCASSASPSTGPSCASWTKRARSWPSTAPTRPSSAARRRCSG